MSSTTICYYGTVSCFTFNCLQLIPEQRRFSHFFIIWDISKPRPRGGGRQPIRRQRGMETLMGLSDGVSTWDALKGRLVQPTKWISEWTPSVRGENKIASLSSHWGQEGRTFNVWELLLNQPPWFNHWRCGRKGGRGHSQVGSGATWRRVKLCVWVFVFTF